MRKGDLAQECKHEETPWAYAENPGHRSRAEAKTSLPHDTRLEVALQCREQQFSEAGELNAVVGRAAAQAELTGHTTRAGSNQSDLGRGARSRWRAVYLLRWATDALVEEDEHEGDADTFFGEPVGVAGTGALKQDSALSSRRS